MVVEEGGCELRVRVKWWHVRAVVGGVREPLDF
jgi:hypothetical protein